MKIAPNQAESYLRRLSPELSAYLLFGPDQGLVASRARRLLALVVEDLQDPFLVADLDAETVRQEPSRLLEEAQSISMIGGRRVVRIRQAGDVLTKPVTPLLKLDVIEALVVIEAGDLGPSSSLRRLFERSGNAAAIACYREEGRAISLLIDEMLKQSGMTIDREAREYLVAGLGADHELSRREIEKLILLHSDRRETAIRLEDVSLALGDGAALAIDDWIFSTLLGKGAAAEHHLRRLLAEGQAPVRLLRAMLIIVRRLLGLRLAEGDPAAIVARAKPPVHFRQRPRFEDVLKRSSARSLGNVLAAVSACEIACKRTGSQPALLLSRLSAVLPELISEQMPSRR